MAYTRTAGTLCAVALACAALAPAAATATTPDGKIFNVVVKTSFGTKFKDCFAFSTNNILSVAGLSAYGTLTFADEPFGKTVSWLSVTGQAFDDAAGFGIAFTGEVTSKGFLYATGIIDTNATYLIVGTPATACAPGAVGHANWKRPA